MSPTLIDARPWAPHAKAAPATEKEGETFCIAANGTRTLSGGWQLEYNGVEPGAQYQLSTEVDHCDLTSWRDALQCKVLWHPIDQGDGNTRGPWNYLSPKPLAASHLRFEQSLKAPEDASSLVIRCTMRWTPTGHARWQTPRIEKIADSATVESITVSVVTGHAHARRNIRSIADNVDFYAALCEKACTSKPDLIVLPEVALQWQLPGSPLDLAVLAPGAETGVFAQIAQKHRTRILLGLFERDGDAVYNTAVLIAPDGRIEGRYHKVHLAVGGESESGILPGAEFPVFDTEIGRIGCNICMDSSACESARMIGLNGADFLLLPIMGDHRADRWSPGNPVFNEDRWQAIMRTRAIDNQLYMVVARNSAQGSCVINRKGEIVAYNDGTCDFIEAHVPLTDGYRTWNGGCFREVNWLQRRPHLYGAYVEASNTGSL